jgi:hypothetical protein
MLARPTFFRKDSSETTVYGEGRSGSEGGSDRRSTTFCEPRVTDLRRKRRRGARHRRHGQSVRLLDLARRMRQRPAYVETRCVCGGGLAH